MNPREDRLYNLLPAVYRQRDAEQGNPLQALLRVIAEQVNVVEDDIARLYENWFIETCDDWVVPYIGDLIGYRPVHEAGELLTRREVANTLRSRRRKGTLAVLEDLSADVAGWPALAVEFYRHLAFTQGINHRRRHRGRTVDLRHGETLDRLDGPFDEIAHSADVRRVASARTPGRPNLPGVGLFVWRLRSYSVTETPAYLVEEAQLRNFTLSVLGNDMPLYIRPETSAGEVGDEGAEGRNLPIPLSRRAFDLHKDDYYGEGKSLAIWREESTAPGGRKLVSASDLVVADLAGWRYQPQPGQVAVDPELGRIAFHPSLQESRVWASYQYGFSADLGGGEYDRPLSQPAGAVVYPVGKEPGQDPTIGAALARWKAATPFPAHAVIEITDSDVYVERLRIDLPAHHSLELRAARRRRPVLRLLDWETSLADSLTVRGGEGSAFTLDGLLVTGRSVHIQGPLAAVTLRHSTLVPGWGLHGDCKPRRPAEPSLELVHLRGRVVIEHCILGSIEVETNEVTTDPLQVRLSDSILDATGPEIAALSAPGHPVAHVRLTVLRSTIFGRVSVHALELGENSLFTGEILVARRQIGCLRFSSYVPGSRTPKRFECQPDLVVQTAVGELQKRHERERVRPLFRTMRYGAPDYARLADDCAEEIRRGADDESEMGAFHDLFEPQRAANLAARLDEYTPAGSDAGLIFAD